jgi:predicted metal-dependent hydrolase
VNNNSIPSFITLNKIGPDIQVSVRLSTRAKRISIRIRDKKVELILPNTNIKRAHTFLLAKEVWVRKKISIEVKKLNLTPNVIPYFGTSLSIQHIESHNSKVEVSNDLIRVYSLAAKADEILLQFLKNKLIIEITKTINALKDKGSFLFSKIKISNNKSSWGSCSSHGILSFNWRLVFVPHEVLYYVIVHEMCHLLEMNHSQKFWSLVSEFCPDYKTHKLWLKEHGLRLHHYLRN